MRQMGSSFTSTLLRIFPPLLLAFAMISCSKSDGAKNNERFPGFTAAGEKSPASLFLADLNTIGRPGDKITFKFVRVLEKGYAIQTGSTNCRGLFQSNEGVQYTDDGTSDRKFPGDLYAIQVVSLPGLVELTQLVCTKANEARGFTGEFSDAFALGILYTEVIEKGNLKVGTRPAMHIPSDFNLARSYQGETGFAKVILSHAFVKNGIKRQIFLTATEFDGDVHNCHACAGLVGGATFVEKQGRWSIETEYPYLQEIGAWGKVDPPRIVTVGPDMPLILFGGSDMHQGYASEWRRGYLPGPSGLTEVLSVGLESENDTQRVEILLDPIRSSALPFDLKVVYSTTEGTTKVTTKKEQIFRFTGNEYHPVADRDALAVGTTAGGAKPVADPDINAYSFVLKIIEAQTSGNDSTVEQTRLQLDGLPKPSQGDRKAARSLNDAGLKALKNGDTAFAIRTFSEAKKRDASDPEIANNLAHALVKENRLTEASGAIIDSLQLSSVRSAAWGTLGLIHAKTGSPERASASFQIAFRYTRSKQATVSYLQNLVDSDTDEKVRQAASLAMQSKAVKEWMSAQ